MTQDMKDKLSSQYVVGDTTDHGKKIVHIVAQKDGYVVYVGDDGKPGFECTKELHNNKTTKGFRQRGLVLHSHIVYIWEIQLQKRSILIILTVSAASDMFLANER
ncbi:MAG: hypothetical protein MRK00_05645 [Nitrosomonas sp.]|nr:hypothetical protein [Nitrosomonas sp.]